MTISASFDFADQRADDAAVVVTDQGQRIDACNGRAAALLGTSPGDLVNRMIGDVLAASGHGAVDFEQLARAGEPWSGPCRALLRPGRELWVTLTPTGTGGGGHSMVLLLADADQRHRTQVALRRLGAIVDSSPDAILSKTTDGIITTWNRGAERLYGYRAEEVIGRHVSVLVPGDRREELRDIMEKVAGGQAVERLETARLRKDGTGVSVLVSVRPLFDDDGAVLGASTITEDLTERAQSERAREAAEIRFQAAFRRSAFAMAMSDLDHTPTAVNPAACELLGRSAAELIGGRWCRFLHPEDVHLEETLEASLLSSDSYSDERRYLLPDGAVVWVQLTVNVVRDPVGRPLCLMSQMQDITARKLMELELQHRAMHDDLTGLPNRALLDDRLEHAIAAAARYGRQSAVAFLDVDGFKYVNDALGHAVGDRLLVEVGRRLLASVRGADTVARFGGDEFVLVLEGIERAALAAAGARIVRALAPPFVVDGHELSVRASIGMTISRPGIPATTLLSEADAAMYRAKELGRDRIVLFDDSLRSRAAAALEVGRRLRAAVQDREIVAVFQPVMDVGTGRPVGVEALARWRHADGRVELPAEFLPMAEANGLLAEMSESVLVQAAAHVARWNARRQSEQLWLSVNVSASQLADRRLAELIDGTLESTALAPHQLRLEITETALMDDIRRSLAALQDLERSGVSVAIDDYGTGYSSLAFLRQLPLYALKIDRSFVAGIPAGGDGDSVVRAILALGRALGLRCIAEGVESDAQLDTLRRLGCELAQGYYWSRPLSAAAFEEWLGDRDTLVPVRANGRRSSP